MIECTCADEGKHRPVPERRPAKRVRQRLGRVSPALLVTAAAFALVSFSSSRSLATTTPQYPNLSLQHFQYDPEVYDRPYDRLTWYLVSGGVFPSYYEILRLKNRGTSGTGWEVVSTINNPSQLTDDVVFDIPPDPVGTVYDYVVVSHSFDGGVASSNRVSYMSLVVDGDFSSPTFPDPYWRLIGDASVFNDSLSSTNFTYGYGVVGGDLNAFSAMIMSAGIPILDTGTGFNLDTATVNIAGHIGDVSSGDTGAAHDALRVFMYNVGPHSTGSVWNTTVATSLDAGSEYDFSYAIPYSTLAGKIIEVEIGCSNDAVLPTSYAFTYLELNIVLKYKP